MRSAAALRNAATSGQREFVVNPNHRMYRCSGVTLIELIVVVAIVALLASIVVPTYTRYTVKTNRAAAAAVVAGIANRQEQFFLDTRQYAANLATLGATVPQEVSRHYTIATSAQNNATPPTFSVTATPVGAQASRDTKCAVLTLAGNGTKTVSGPGPATDCW